jgi:hypothetical protein
MFESVGVPVNGDAPVSICIARTETMITEIENHSIIEGDLGRNLEMLGCIHRLKSFRK